MGQTRLERLKQDGFDWSYRSRGQAGQSEGAVIYAGCSQCEVLVINGVASHETGCPNAVHECKGCCDLVLMRQRYCADCQ